MVHTLGKNQIYYNMSSELPIWLLNGISKNVSFYNFWLLLIHLIKKFSDYENILGTFYRKFMFQIHLGAKFFGR